MKAITKQNRDGIAPELAEEKRFIELYGFGKDKVSKGWSNPNNWRYLDDIPEEKAFAYVVAGDNSTYACIDYDHVMDESGQIFKPAWDLYREIEKLGGTYTEYSMSGHGLHQFVDLGDYADSFEMETNDDRRIILWMDHDEYNSKGEEEQKNVPKVELYFGTKGKYIVPTGRNFKKPHRVARNELAAEIWHTVLKVRDETQAKYGSRKEETTDAEVRLPVDDLTRKRIVEALQYISADNYAIWVKVGQACYNCGIPFEVWDTWSRFTDQLNGVACDKYKPDETPKKWKSFKNTLSKWNAGTIFILAKKNGWSDKAKSLRPEDESDLGQAEVFAREYGEEVCFSKKTGFLVYNGSVWEEDDLKAQGLSQQLTDRQLREAKQWINKTRIKLEAILEGKSKGNPDDVKQEALKAAAYWKFVLSRRASNKIAATLTEAGPKLQIDVDQLDSNPYLLNTPGGTVDLMTGECRPHDPKDYCTKITTVAPDQDNEEIFATFLADLTCGDISLMNYLQEVVGGCAIGAVKREELIIATGSGGNGKSTFFNLIQKCLGSYAGNMASETLTADNRKNKAPELAELRGKRLVIAAELEEGTRLDTGTMKKLCSTDKIHCEPKYKQPYDFVPSHHIIMFTNHLPRVGASDSGTWDRLVVVPFNARFRGASTEVKDYASYLYEMCGGAVLSWVIEGAQRLIANKFFIDRPECVEAMTAEYKADNDWLHTFLMNRCCFDPTYQESGGSLYKSYRDYCTAVGEYTRSAAEFSQAITNAGYEGKKTKVGKVYRGLRVKNYSEMKHDNIEAIKQA